MSGGRRQAVGATRRRNRHIARKRTRNATDGRTDAARAHRRIQDSGGGHGALCKVCTELPWLDLLAWTQREVGEGVGLAQPNVRQRIIRFCKTGESAKSYNAEADDPEGEKAGPDPYQMVRAGTARRARTWAG